MKKTVLICFTLIVFKLGTALAPRQENEWIVWNVGQGQWVTHVLPLTCIHYDFGGELGTFKTIRQKFLKKCALKENRLRLSHWDYDHFLNLPFLVKAVPRVCWDRAVPHPPRKSVVQKVLDLKVPRCGTPFEVDHSESWRPKHYRTTNDSSEIYLNQKVLLTGDSPIRQEKKWIHYLPGINRAEILLLGHHGSATSTGQSLLNHLPQLKLAVASARKARFGHPHRKVLKRLTKSKIPVLTTEDWGNIHIEF